MHNRHLAIHRKLSCLIFKVDIQDFSHIAQTSVFSVEQTVFTNVIIWPYPLSLEYSPERFRKVSYEGVCAKKEDETSSFLLNFAMSFNFLSSMNLRIIKHDNDLLVDAKR